MPKGKIITFPRKVLFVQRDQNQITTQISDYKLQHLEKHKHGFRQHEEKQTLFLNKPHRQNLDEDLIVATFRNIKEYSSPTMPCSKKPNAKQCLSLMIEINPVTEDDA